LTPMCDLDLRRRDLNFACDIQPHNSEHLCQVILKSLFACRSFALDKRFSMTSKCDLDLEAWFLCTPHFLLFLTSYLYWHSNQVKSYQSWHSNQKECTYFYIGINYKGSYLDIETKWRVTFLDIEIKYRV
jgi:hypothetical protein